MINEQKNEVKGGSIGLVPSLALVIGMVIGSGVFFKPRAVFGATGAPGLGITAWVVGGIISIAGGLTAAEIAAAVPKAGGVVAWLEEAYGEIVGFLFGWMQTVVYFPAIIAALSIIFATQVINLGAAPDSALKIIAIGTAIFLFLMNFISTKLGAGIQTVATIAKLIPLIAIIIVGLASGQGGSVNLVPMTMSDHPVVSGFGQALVATMFAYDGWINVGAISGEMKDPAKNLPKAIIGGLSIVMAIYVTINIAYLFVLPATTLAASKAPAADVAKIIFGQNGGKIITVGILISIFGALNGNILAGMRIPHKLGTEGSLPCSNFFGKLNEKFGTPVNSGLFLLVLAIAYIFSGQFDMLTDLTVFISFLFYILVFYGVMKMRKEKPDMLRPYKVPFYPVLPILAIVGGAFILVMSAKSDWKLALGGLVATLIGVPVFKIMKKKNA